MMQSAPFNYRRLIIWIGRIVLGAIFIFAGVSKVFFPTTILWPLFALKFSVTANLAHFGDQVASYKMLPDAGVYFVAHTLPFFEVFLGLMLLFGWRLRIWGAVVTLLMVGFVTAVTRAYLLDMKIDCGCFAVPEPVSLRKILEDSAMAILAIFMTVFAFQEARRPHPWSAPAKPAT